MKTRSSYVSNSSSSSFILKESKATRHLTGKDWNEMIISLLPNYRKRCKESIDAEREYGLEHDDYPVFCAFDMKKDRDEATRYLKDILEGWTASNCIIKDGKLKQRKGDVGYAWHKFLQKVGMMVEDEMVDERGYAYADAWVHCHDREDIRGWEQVVDVQTTDGSFRRLKVDEKYLKMLEDKWDEMGICDNYQVLQSAKARFAVHFDENEYCCIKGVTDDNGDWETESFTYGRLCEVFAKWLVAHGKVPSDFSWHTLVNDTLTVNMHEG